jgi:hypothetical protein
VYITINNLDLSSQITGRSKEEGQSFISATNEKRAEEKGFYSGKKWIS